MNEENKELLTPEEPPKFKPSQSFLIVEVLEVLRNLTPTTWDLYATDLILIQRVRWNWDLTNAEAIQAFYDGVAEEAKINSARYKQYVASGGKVIMKKDPFGGPDEVEVLPESNQTGGFVTGGRIVGDQIILETEVGTVNTATDRILTFRLFQQDVLRSTGTIYESRFKKQHESSVSDWLTHLSRAEKKEEDDTLPLNILRDYMEEFLSYAETEPARFESAIKNKFKPILRDGREWQFSPDNITSWLKAVDKERKWKKSEIKIYLQHIYGERFTSEKRAFNCRVFSIMQTKPDVPQNASFIKPAPRTEPADHTEVQHDSGSGQDHTPDPGRTGPAETGSPAAGDSDPVVQQVHSAGDQGPTTFSPDIPF